MNFIRCNKNKRQTVKRSYSFADPTTPTSPVSTVVEDVEEEDEIDYTPSIQQEAAGIVLQKTLRKMIQDQSKNYNRWSEEHKKWIKKYKDALKTEDPSLQSYTTTLKLFEVAVSSCDEISNDFENKSKELDKVLRKIPRCENPWVKSELDEQESNLNEEKQKGDDLEKQMNALKKKIDQKQTKLRACSENTKQYEELENKIQLYKQELKKLKQEKRLQVQQYQCAQKQNHINNANIHDRSQKKELTRLKIIPDALTNFIEVLELNSESLTKAIDKHKPDEDLHSWNEKYFSSSIKQTAV